MRIFRMREYLPAVFLVIFLASCGPSFHQKNERYVMVCANMNLPYWQQAKSGLMDSANALGVKAEFTGSPTYDPQAELKRFDAVVATHPTGILVSPARADIFRDAINSATKAGIPVICLDSDAPDSRRILFIGTNNYKAGLTSGETIAKVMQEHGHLAIITIPGQYNLDERLDGVQDALKKYPYIQVVKVLDDQGNTQTASDEVSSLMQSGTKPDAILCLEASGGPGAAAALVHLELEGKIPIVAMDANPETLDWISKGAIAASVAQKPYTMAYYGLKLLDDLHHNIVHEFKDWKTAPTSPLPSIIDTGTGVVDSSNVDDYKAVLSTPSAGQ
ncbi:MAG TPA: substrate-binding domain-containing protein [Terriglobia bacterium]|nr:substrate-binding domain-containing protein [Terriglobia bacterium]